MLILSRIRETPRLLIGDPNRKPSMHRDQGLFCLLVAASRETPQLKAPVLNAAPLCGFPRRDQPFRQKERPKKAPLVGERLR